MSDDYEKKAERAYRLASKQIHADDVHAGLTYREWLVGHALAGVASGALVHVATPDDREEVVTAITKTAIEVADEVIWLLAEEPFET